MNSRRNFLMQISGAALAVGARLIHVSSLAAAGPGPQHGIGRGSQGEPVRIAAVSPVRVGGSGDPAPGAAHVVVGQVGPGGEP